MGVSYSCSKHAVPWDMGVKVTFALFASHQASEDEGKIHRYVGTRESRLSGFWGFLLIKDRISHMLNTHHAQQTVLVVCSNIIFFSVKPVK